MPRVNCSPRGGCPDDRSKQWPSNKRCSSSYSAVTTPLTWHKGTKHHLSNGYGKKMKRMLKGYLLQVDVVQVMRAADSLNHPALWSNHIKGEKGRLWDFHEAGKGTRWHCVIGQEWHIRLQDKAVKAVKNRGGCILGAWLHNTND